MFVPNIPCVTYFVTSSVVAIEPAICKINVYDEIMITNQKTRMKYCKQKNVYINLHLMEFTWKSS